VLLSDLLIPRDQDRALDLLGLSGTVVHIMSEADGPPPRTRSSSAELAARCGRGGIRYVRVAAGTPIEDLLFGTLRARSLFSATMR
jgi:hypothetical protein